MAKGEIDDLTMEQYLTLTRGNQAPGVVKLEIGGNVNLKIKSQFIQELREDTFSRKKNDDAHEHVKYGYSKNRKKTVKTGQTRTRDRKECTRTGDLIIESDMAIGPSGELDGAPTLPDGRDTTKTMETNLTMADHSQKWHDGSSSRSIYNNSNAEGIPAIVSKLDSLGRDMKKLKENVHAIQVGCQICGGAHLDKECP
ncbi:hypothetical protein Tco_1244479 [Tanacetum coccineum]